MSKPAPTRQAELVPLAEAIAAPGDGTARVTAQDRVAPGIPVVTVQAGGPGGAYDVTVSVIGQDFAAEQWTNPCTPTDEDAKPCHVELAEADRVAVSVAFTDGSGRATLTYAADAGQGRTVLVQVDNYTEQAGRQKVVGPTWKAAGVTPSVIREAIAQSGLFD